MTDLKMRWDDALGEADLVLEDDDLAVEHGLGTAVLISLFTDRRAEPDDVIPGPAWDRRGFWADSLTEEGKADPIGSRLWLLERRTMTAANLELLRRYAEEALAWMVREGLVHKVTVTVRRVNDTAARLLLRLDHPSGPRNLEYDWSAA
ncbi:MAG: phage GP46 family protein [Caulobacteraceae bacterium]